eukprot:TRINITY_DN34046_c0_g1_i2.p2 TRINITY_DN34046_c0_g1~~TRINITY_DN34046_c0_g1_i2.p2  ORF type:complete len:103 (+),score=27.28 TRINITY_DN34046_c0_g1_i2:110-418(+)
MVWNPSDKQSKYTVDYVFDPKTATRTVYEKVGTPIMAAIAQGYNGTIFAYGQTFSGKTHTMFGDTKNVGIIGYAIDDLFELMEIGRAVQQECRDRSRMPSSA